ncbi:PREDICTED: abhydrolase domain-containing protein 8 [Elephantulus edwardii]|uniref:abhydrolase domain-containing protein 8 n=1 Tax=Elephantulus edwardii TaxID=28737 RepID=UPI0003F05D97|nr:PREDICTED: abhydrolase domain-containing protein 8 [Elephantulus edwardii]
MLTGVTDGIFCCLLGAPPNTVGPLESVESSDGYTFVEVKPGRVLRVKHAGPAPAPTPPPPPAASPDDAQEDRSGLVRCQRRITVYRNGRLLVENLGREPRADLLHWQNGSGEPPTALEKRTIHIDCEKRITSCKGAQADVVLFFIHGVGGSLAIWKEQLDFFVRLGYEVVAPDLAGHGASSAPQVAAAYTFYALAEDMRAIFKRYAKKRNVLIGHSYGVSFCTFLAHEYPDLVHKVIMINGGGPTALEPSFCSIFNMPTCVLHCLSPCLAWSFLKAGFARQGAKEKQLLKEGNAFNVSSFVLRAMMSGQYWPEGDEVYHAELTVPVLLVHGMHDKFVPVEEDQRMAEILLLAFLKLIEEGSHMVMLECPETVNTLLHEFLLWEPEPTPQALPAPPEEKK